MGCKTANSITSGNKNIILGATAGQALTTGSENIFLGSNAGTAVATGEGCSIAIGYLAYCGGESTGQQIFIGKQAGARHRGDTNIGIGFGALLGSSTASANTGTDNIAIGQCTGEANTSGTKNVFIGRAAGNTNTSGNCNIAIGYDIELPSATANNQMAIGNDTSRWITGDSSFHIQPGAGIRDTAGNLGSAGQVLCTTGSAVAWTAAGGGGGGVSQAKATAIHMIFG